MDKRTAIASLENIARAWRLSKRNFSPIQAASSTTALVVLRRLDIEAIEFAVKLLDEPERTVEEG